MPTSTSSTNRSNQISQTLQNVLNSLNQIVKTGVDIYTQIQTAKRYPRQQISTGGGTVIQSIPMPASSTSTIKSNIFFILAIILIVLIGLRFSLK